MKPADIQIPSIIQTDEGREAFYMRMAVFMADAPATDLAKTIALTEALDADRIIKGELKL